MITIKNTSEEDLELVQAVDTTVEGCRLAEQEPTRMLFKPGEEITFMGYEPGTSLTIRPRRSPQYPRVTMEVGGILKYRAIAPEGVIPCAKP